MAPYLADNVVGGYLPHLLHEIRSKIGVANKHLTVLFKEKLDQHTD